MRAVVLAAALAAGSAVCSGIAAAQPDADAIAWLQRVYRSTERLSYTGTFVYQHGEQVETSRITRIVDASGVHERLETLDGTPREIVNRLNSELHKALASPDLKERLAAAGIEPLTDTPEHFAGFIKSETARYAKVIKDAGIKIE